ncbi:MAG: type I pantothenate kinase [Hyphomonas sp.]
MSAPLPPTSPDTYALAEQLSKRIDSDGLIIGLTGSVASGKSTLAGQLKAAFDESHKTETVSTDGFLFPNAVLEERNLMLRKGFPESYDVDAIADALTRLRTGSADFPGYSHVTYDIDPSLQRTISRPDVFILEGLGFPAPSPHPRDTHEPDVFIYLDADEDHLLEWYLERFERYWIAAKDDPTSFYANFTHMTQPEMVTFATSVWERINLPNLRNHISPLKSTADIVLKKTRDHTTTIATNTLV